MLVLVLKDSFSSKGINLEATYVYGSDSVLRVFAPAAPLAALIHGMDAASSFALYHSLLGHCGVLRTPT